MQNATVAKRLGRANQLPQMRQLASVSARTASRMIAGETGVSHTTVRRARKPTGTIVSVAKRVGNGRQGPQATAGRPPANGNYTPARLTSMYGTAERWIALTSRVPIHIVYMSTYVADSGKLVVKPDIYGYDAERPQAKRPRGLHWSDQQRCGRRTDRHHRALRAPSVRHTERRLAGSLG